MTNRITVCFWGLWYLPGCSIVGKNRWRSKLCQSLAGETDVVCKPSFQLTSPKFYRNIWDHSVVSDGFKGTSNVFIRNNNNNNIRLIHEFFAGFAQKRRSDGSFVYTNPIDCSPQDKNSSRECSLQGDNENGFYESSSWEYSWYVVIFQYLWMIINMFKVCSSWHCILDTTYGWKCDEF